MPRLEYSFTTNAFCNHPPRKSVSRDGMCGCPEGCEALNAFFLAFLTTQKPNDKHPLLVTLWTKDKLHWAPPYVFNMNGPLWGDKLDFIAQFPEKMHENLLDPNLVPWSYEWAWAKWDALFSVTLSYVSSV